MTPPTLRSYQFDAVEAVFREWESVASTMIVMATGLGKTVTFCEIVRRLHPKRSIIIAHRNELIHQAVGALEKIGLRAEIEMGDTKADASMFFGDSTIVASVQSLNSGKKDDKRMKKFRPEDFSLLVIDEFHHSVSPSYRAVIDHFLQNPNLKVLGVTATPDRLDQKALGLICDSVAFKYDIADAVEHGYLVPIEQQMVHIKSLDFSKVRTTAGDLNGGDLAAVMEDEKNLLGMVGASIEIIGRRSSIAFTSSVRHAEMCCDIFNRYRPGMAAWISGTTPEDDRRSILKKFKEGEIQVLTNVGIATEGFDAPNAEVVIVGRPTKSRALYTQMIGRITRPLPGVLDGMHSAFERCDAIACSPKPSALVLDFVGNSGKHKLMTTADVLGGNYDEEVRDMAVLDASKSGGAVRMADALKKAQKAIIDRIEAQKRAEAARRAKLIAEVKFSTRNISPFDVFQITPKKDSSWDRGRPLSEGQKNVLRKMGVNPDELNYAAAKQLLHKHFERIEKQLCSFKQAKVLMRSGYASDEIKKMTFREASQIIDGLAKNGWKRNDQFQFA